MSDKPLDVNFVPTAPRVRTSAEELEMFATMCGQMLEHYPDSHKADILFGASRANVDRLAAAMGEGAKALRLLEGSGKRVES